MLIFQGFANSRIVREFPPFSFKVRIATLTRNQVYGNVSWVRIPPLPPLGNNTNPDDKLEFVLFFSNEYFGIKVDLNGKKKKLPGV